ncbi:MAG: hypothetical protein U0R69_10020 [Gaiellales bacterium]
MRREPLYVSGDAGVPAVGPPAPAGDPFRDSMLRAFGSGGYGLRRPLTAGGYASPGLASLPTARARPYGPVGGGYGLGAGGLGGSRRPLALGYGRAGSSLYVPVWARAPLFNPFLGVGRG